MTLEVKGIVNGGLDVQEALGMARRGEVPLAEYPGNPSLTDFPDPGSARDAPYSGADSTIMLS